MTTSVSARGVEVPSLGLGTWQLTGAACVEAVRHALDLGYRHLDTARMYRNEAQVGQGLRASGVDRSAVWITTKVWRDDVRPERLERAAEDSLRRLGTDYVDLLLLHWPVRSVPLAAQLEGLVRVRERGLIRQLGVSNYDAVLLREAAALAPVFCDQVEYHPFRDQSAVLAACDQLDVVPVAYSPLAQGAAHDDPVLTAIGAVHGKTGAQVALRWIVEQGVAAIPRSRSAANRASNLDIFDFALTADERDRIARLGRRAERVG